MAGEKKLKKIVFILFFLVSTLYSKTDPDIDFINCDFDRAFSNYLKFSILTEKVEEAEIRLAQAWELRKFIQNDEKFTNTINLLKRRNDPYLNFICELYLANYFFEKNDVERVKSSITSATIITQWLLSGCYNRAGGVSDLDYAFFPEKNNTIPYFTNELVIHPPLIGYLYNILGEIKPYEQTVPSSGTVYLKSELLSENEEKTHLYIETSESFKVFLNGTNIFRRYASDKGEGRRFFIPVFLKKGINHLLIKIVDSTESPSIRVLLCKTNIKPLPIQDYFQTNINLAIWKSYIEGEEKEIHKIIARTSKKKLTPMITCFYAWKILEGNLNQEKISYAMQLIDEQRTCLSETLKGLYFHLKRMSEKALKFYQSATLINTNAFFPAFLLTKLFKDLKWQEKFLDSFSRLLSVNKNSVQLWELLADSELKYESSYETYLKLASLAPSKNTTLIAADFLINHNFFEDALKVLDSYRKLYPFSLEERRLRFLLFNRLCDTKKAKEILLDTLNKTAGNSDFFIYLSEISENNNERLYWIQQALKIKPSDLTILDRLYYIISNRPFTMEEYLDPELRKNALQIFFSTSCPKNVSAETLLNEEVTIVYPDGRWSSVNRQIIRICNKEGIRFWGNPAVDATKDLRILSAKTILKNKEEIYASSPIRQNNRLVFTMPSVREDSLIEITTFTPRENGVNGTFFHSSPTRFLGMINQPTKILSHTIITPSELEYKVVFNSVLSNLFSIKEYKDKGLLRTVIYATNIPAIKEEPYLPPFEQIFSTWKTVRFPQSLIFLAEWYKSIITPVIDINPEINDLLFKLSENKDLKKKDLNLIKYLYDWICNTIITYEGGLYFPYSLNNIVKERRGTVQEKTLLMKYFLDRLEISNRILLCRLPERGSISFSNSVIYPEIFDEPVISFDFKGSTIFLDLSDTFPFGIIGLEKRKALALNTEKGEPVILPEKFSEPDIIFITNTVTIRTDKTLIKGERCYRGAFTTYGKFLKDPQTAESKIDQIENMYIPGITITNITVSEIPSLSYSFKGYIERFGTVYDNNWLIPFICKRFNLENFLFSEKRKNSLWINIPTKQSEITVYNLSEIPNLVDITLPQDTFISNKYGKFSIKWEKNSTKVKSEYFVDIPSQIINPGDYSEFSLFCHQINEKINNSIIIKLKND